MKAIKIGNKVEIYNDTVKTFNKLPVKSYIVRFDKMTGFYLEEYSKIKVNEEKIYGAHYIKAKKVMDAYGDMNRNLGIILSGHKGIGKSLFVKVLAVESISRGIPLIFVDKYMEGIASYLERIEQEVVVIFDEFDKTFGDVKRIDGDIDPQASMLGLFDGISGGKKMFVITCNNIDRLNDYIINRPGRFHYHFRFGYPEEAEIREYLKDKLKEEYYGEIEQIVEFSKRVDLNYDCLRAIAFELNSGEKFKEAVRDLNIINTKQERYNITLYFENGERLKAYGKILDLFDDEENSVDLRDEDYNDVLTAFFHMKDCKYSEEKRGLVIEREDFRLVYNEDYDEELTVSVKDMIPDYLKIEKVKERKLHYQL